jgi:hypothetical protein
MTLVEGNSKEIQKLEKKPEAIVRGVFLVFRSRANDNL